MSEDTNEVLRRQIVKRTVVLALVGIGYCPGCHQPKAIFARRRVTPGPSRERCLECWKAERSGDPAVRYDASTRKTLNGWEERTDLCQACPVETARQPRGLIATELPAFSGRTYPRDSQRCASVARALSPL